MSKQRDVLIDYARGIAILIVYLGHSIIYHPIKLGDMYKWCNLLLNMIESFHMPLFFFISGFLFAYSKKTNMQVINDKIKRLVIPYFFTMGVVIVAKMLLPGSMASQDNEGGNFLLSVIVYGGDRWFVYVMFLTFLFSLPFRPYKSSIFFLGGAFLCCCLLNYYTLLPREFLLFKVATMIPFFFVGMFTNQYYSHIKGWLVHNFLWVVLLFIIVNIVFVIPLSKIELVNKFFLPNIGITFILALASIIEQYSLHLEKKPLILHYLEYCGKYSLQFYLFTFAYPVIRVGVVNWLHITNPYLIIMLVMSLQLISITLIIEITRRIKILTIPMGY